MRLLYDNKFLAATITVSSENPNYPQGNMQDEILAKVFRSIADNVTIKISTQTKASYVSIMGHNLTSTATITLQGNNTDVWGAPSFSETIPYRSDMCILKFTEATYNYWRVIIDDSDSAADGYIELGCIYLGTYLQMPGMKLDQTLELKDNSKSSQSYSGQNYGDLRYQYRNPQFNFPFLSHDQKDNLNTMWTNNRSAKPLICLVWANDYGIEAPMYCIVDQKELSFKRNGESRRPWSTKIKFREVF